MRTLLLFWLQLLQVVRFSLEYCETKWANEFDISIIKTGAGMSAIETGSKCDDYYICHNVPSNDIFPFTGSQMCLMISDSNIPIVPSIGHTSSLHGVNLDGNFITFLDKHAFAGLPKLKQLSARSNTIAILPDGLFISNSNLKIVDLSYNIIHTIKNNTFSDSIEYINLMHNKLQKLDFHLPDSLINLDISFNMISYILETSFEKTTKLDTLNLNNNMLTALSPVLLISCNSLLQLDLSYNNISFLNRDIFESLHQMESLVLSNNALQSLNFTLPGSLTSIDLSYNSLSFIDKKSFSRTTKLNLIQMVHNLLKTVPVGLFDELKDLIQIHLTYNNIKSLPKDLFAANHNLQYLYLDDNNIQTVNFSLPQSLTDLDLSYNYISRIESNSFYRLDSLRHLTLKNNLLRCLPVGGFYSLKELFFLDLSSNNIMITYGTFRGLTNLKTLHIANNSIIDLPELALNDLKNLSSLDVSYNSLSTLNVRDLTEHLNHLRSVRLEGNPFKCSYLTELITQFSRISGVQVEEGSQFFESNVKGIGCIPDNQAFTSFDDDARESRSTTSSDKIEMQKFIKKVIAEFDVKWKDNQAKENASPKDGNFSYSMSIFQTFLLFGIFVIVIFTFFIKYGKHRRNRRVVSLTEIHSLRNIEH